MQSILSPEQQQSYRKRPSKCPSNTIRCPEDGKSQSKLLIGIVSRDVKRHTRNISTFQSTDKEASRVQPGSTLQEDLRPSHCPPEYHCDGQESLWTHDFADHIEWEFCDDEADNEERLSCVDLGIANVDVLSEGISEGISDVGPIELKEAEEKDQEWHDDQVDLQCRLSYFCSIVLDVCIVSGNLDG